MQGLVRGIAAALSVVACSREQQAPPPPAKPVEPPIVAAARASIAEARKHIPEKGCIARGEYVALRRAIAETIPLVRYSVMQFAELIIGPRVVIGETAGSLGELDVSTDCDRQAAALFQIDQALRVIESELVRRPPERRAVFRGLSDAAYALGAEALESTAGTPSEPDAVMADLEGTRAGLLHGLAALDVKLAVPEVTGPRLAIALASGPLGDAIRALGAVPPPYAPLFDGASVGALTLPKPLVPADPPRVALGAALFADKRLSRGRVHACTTCHDPNKSWSDGRVTPRSLDPKLPLLRNTPTLLYAPVAAVLHWDGRIRTADAQALNVIHARAEMGLAAPELLKVIRDDASWKKQFEGAFADGVTEANVGHALAAYESAKLVPGKSPIDRLARGDASAWTADMAAGLEVFVTKGRCARCHVPPTFGGARPPDFTAPIYGVLGVPIKPGDKTLDPDLGRGVHTKSAADAHSFRTPTVRNVGTTAPYFHHGTFPTLELVVDLYDKGGGKALGLDVPNQDPDVRELALTAEERRVLLVFLREALRDGP